jgi:hypothetical protein
MCNNVIHPFSEACKNAYISEPNNFKIVGEDLVRWQQNY